MIGRLVLSDRNIYKIKQENKNISGRKCLILSESHDDILIKSSKNFTPKDDYVKINPLTNTIVETLGSVGNPKSDINIYHHLYTLNWMSKSKYNKLWEQVDCTFDLSPNRIEYNNKVITIDPKGSIDLDDGFSFSFDDKYYYLSIHVSDPVSLVDPTKPIWAEIFKELIVRLQTCYIDLNEYNSSDKSSSQTISKLSHLLPDKIIKQISLLNLDQIENKSFPEPKRAISFCFRLEILTEKIDFDLKFTNLTNIQNFTYENYDDLINLKENLETKNNLISMCNKLIKIMKVNLENIPTNTNISHRIIEIFMIFVNWYSGNYLINNNWKKTIIRIQDLKIFDDKFDINQVPLYVRPILSYGANYSYANFDPNTNNNTNINTSTHNTHNTLGINNYAHISSPMRRLIDMINHFGFYQIPLDKIIPDFDKYFDLDKINLKLKNYKKISNSYDLLCFIKNYSGTNTNTNKFKACLLDWVKLDNLPVINCTLVLNNNIITKVINVELPQIDLTLELKKYMEFDVELFYNPNKFKSNKFPFSIKILS